MHFLHCIMKSAVNMLEKHVKGFFYVNNHSSYVRNQTTMIHQTEQHIRLNLHSVCWFTAH